MLAHRYAPMIRRPPNNNSFSMRKIARLPLLPLQNLLTPSLLLLAIGINLRAALQHFPTAMHNDSYTYLAYAKSLLSQGPAFFLDAGSVRIIPMSYIYPSLLGADPTAIKIGNSLLSCLLLLVLYRIGTLLHSHGAGVIAAFLYALSPLMAEYKPAILTEPLFLFLFGVWTMAVAETVAGRRTFVPLAGLACGLMILTRGTYIYFLYAVLLVAILLWVKTSWRQVGKDLFAAHFLAVLFPLLLILKNWLAFGYPGLATGVGTALYLGSHPLTGGYEPPYFALGYNDNNAVLQGLDHLSIAGDALLKGVGLFMLKQQTAAEILLMYLRKVSGFVFVSKAILADSIWNLRSLRIAEIVLGTIGLFSLRSTLMRCFIGGALAYQVLVHMPLLYTHRYSVGALDVPLIVLSAVGIAVLWNEWRYQPRPFMKLGATAALLAMSIGIGEWHRQRSQVLMPDILAVPHEKIHHWDTGSLAALSGNGAIAEGNGAYRTTETLWTLEVPVPPLPLKRGEEYYVWSIGMEVSAPSSLPGCGVGAVYYRAIDEPAFSEIKSRYFRVVGDGRQRYYHLSASPSMSPIFPAKAGFLRIAGNCPTDSRIRLHDILLSRSTVAETYRERYLKQENSKNLLR